METRNSQSSSQSNKCIDNLGQVLSNELIIIYICDSSDGRQLIRQRKFNYWFYFFVQEDFVKYDDTIHNIGGESYPVTIILKEQNPYKIQIISDFITAISGYNSEK